MKVKLNYDNSTVWPDWYAETELELGEWAKFNDSSCHVKIDISGSGNNKQEAIDNLQTMIQILQAKLDEIDWTLEIED